MIEHERLLIEKKKEKAIAKQTEKVIRKLFKATIKRYVKGYTYIAVMETFQDLHSNVFDVVTNLHGITKVRISCSSETFKSLLQQENIQKYL